MCSNFRKYSCTTTFMTVLILLCLSIGFISGLRWDKSPFVKDDKLETFIYLSQTSDGPKIDVYKGEQIVVVKNMDTYRNKITIYCFIAGYGDPKETTYQFCKKDKCDITLKGEMKGTNQNIYDLIISYDTNPSKGRGLIMELGLEQNKDSSGDYYCRASYEGFEIRSNIIQIRDANYWKENLVASNNNARIQQPVVTKDMLPITFNCNVNLKTAPKWTKQEFSSPVSWSVCPVLKEYEKLTANTIQTFSDCATYTIKKSPEGKQEINPHPVEKIMDSYITPDGSLVVFQNPKNARDKTFALMCYSMSQGQANPINTYYISNDGENIKEGVKFDEDSLDYQGVLKRITPENNEISIYTRKKFTHDDKYPVSLYADYRAKNSGIKYNWYKEGVDQNPSNLYSMDRFRLNFISDITTDMAGNYKLVVQQGADQLTFNFKVDILGPPILVNPDCLPLIKHIWEHDGSTFSCTYKDKPKVLKISINSLDIKVGQSLKESQSQLEKAYPYLNLLNFTTSMTPADPAEINTLTYSPSNLRMTQGHQVYQDHTVTFFVENDLGLSVKSTSIYTVPKVRDLIRDAPEATNCTTACSSKDSHTFKCRIDTEKFMKKELKVEHYWTINGYRLEIPGANAFSFYTVVDPVTKDLTLQKIESNNTKNDEFVKEQLKNNFIVCHLDLTSVLGDASGFSYKSDVDSSLGTMLKAKIMMDYQPLNTAYIYWIVAVMLFLLLIIIVVVLLTRWCMSNRGETYQVDKLEREHGYDREKEAQEEKFKPYEREDHETDVLSSSIGDRRMSTTGQSIGSGNDGELDGYASDMDPANFNEEGSIIGKYGANSRNRAQMT